MSAFARICDQHRRPDPNSYWVVPGRLLAGEYPGALDEATARWKIRRLLAAGIAVFVDLTEPGELAPYGDYLTREAKALGVEATHLRSPIRDVCVPRRADDVVAVLDAIDSAMDEGRGVYVHCWGGIGRTGTIVGCYLVRHGLSGEEALARIARWWKLVEKSWRRPRSPETPDQCSYVRAWQTGK